MLFTRRFIRLLWASCCQHDPQYSDPIDGSTSSTCWFMLFDYSDFCRHLGAGVTEEHRPDLARALGDQSGNGSRQAASPPIR